MTTIRQSIQVNFHYPVCFTRHLFDAENPVLVDELGSDPDEDPKRCMVFIDQGLLAAQPALAERIEGYFRAHVDRLVCVAPPVALPGGEAAKNDYHRIMEVVDLLLEFRLCRQSYVLAVGGGALLDAVGFAASMVHRGLRLVRCPSTVLAQNDAGIGVKNGMNLHGGKNTIGTFQPPYAVFNDAALLDSLDDTHWRGGIAEAFKVALIQDAEFLQWLYEQAGALRRRDPEAMARQIKRCAELHLDHIRSSGDPFELGSARPLDFGHWAAHKLESMSAYRVPHGQAVAAGMALDCVYAESQGWIRPSELQDFLDALGTSGLPIWYPEFDRRLGDGSRDVLQGLEDFREHLGGRLCITFPDGLGRRREEQTVDLDAMNSALDRLEDYAAQRNIAASSS